MIPGLCKLAMKKTSRFSPRLKDYDLRDPRSKREYNAKVFAAVAPRYGRITRLLSFGRDRAWKRILVDSLPAAAPLRVLDLACGTGDLARALARKYPAGQIVALDLSPEMIGRARQAGGPLRIRFALADMGRVPAPDALFDVITGGYALRNAPDLEGVLREIRRLLKPGGMGAFLDFSKSDKKARQAVQLFLLRLWGSIWGILFHRNPEVYGYIAASLRVFPDRRALVRMIERAGFRDVRCRLFFFGFTALITFRQP